MNDIWYAAEKIRKCVKYVAKGCERLGLLSAINKMFSVEDLREAQEMANHEKLKEISELLDEIQKLSSEVTDD